MTLIQTAAWASAFTNEVNNKHALGTVAIVKLQDGTYFSYFTNNLVSLEFNSTWGETEIGEIYKDNADWIHSLKPVDPTNLLTASKIAEVYINTTAVIKSENIAVEVVKQIGDKLDLK